MRSFSLQHWRPLFPLQAVQELGGVVHSEPPASVPPVAKSCLYRLHCVGMVALELGSQLVWLAGVRTGSPYA